MGLKEQMAKKKNEHDKTKKKNVQIFQIELAV